MDEVAAKILGWCDELDKELKPWFWSNEEGVTWNGPFWSRDEAIFDSIEETGDDCPSAIWLGRGDELDPADWIDSKFHMENYADANPENCPVDEDWSMRWGLLKKDHDELDDILRAAFAAWVKARNEPSYYSVSTTEKLSPETTGGGE